MARRGGVRRSVAAGTLALLCGAPACGAGAPPAQAPTAPVLSASGGEVCADALAMQRARWAAFDARWTEVLAAVGAGDETRSAAAGEIASQELYEWARALGDLLPRAADAPLRAAIEATMTALNALAAPEDATPADQMRAKVRDAAAPLAAVCGGTPPPVP